LTRSRVEERAVVRVQLTGVGWTVITTCKAAWVGAERTVADHLVLIPAIWVRRCSDVGDTQCYPPSMCEHGLDMRILCLLTWDRFVAKRFGLILGQGMDVRV
jgi:hypothetical protein